VVSWFPDVSENQSLSTFKVRRQNNETEIFKKSELLATCFTLVYCFAYSSTLKMEAAYSSEMSVDFQRYIPEDRPLHVFLSMFFALMLFYTYDKFPVT
jgi:hypothetical protein